MKKPIRYEEPETSEVDGEQGRSEVRRDRQLGTQRAFAALALVLVGVVVLGLGYLAWQKIHRAKQGGAQAKAMAVSSPSKTFEFANSPAPPPPVGHQGAEPAANHLNEGNVAAANAQQGPAPAVLDKSRSSMFSRSNVSSVGEGGEPSSQKTVSPQTETALAQLLKPTKLNASSASLLGNLNYILPKSAVIPCDFETKLDSTLPGMPACVVNRPVYSANGHVVLIDRGSVITGEYQANLRLGQKRLFALGGRITTPNGVVIDADSMMADPLGGTGVEGYVDNHYRERFGAALVLMLIDDAAQAAANSTAGNSQNQINYVQGNPVQSLAQQALQNSINIQPTLSKNHGETAVIFVARDLDFSKVYGLER